MRDLKDDEEKQKSNREKPTGKLKDENNHCLRNPIGPNLCANNEIPVTYIKLFYLFYYVAVRVVAA
jgi:hypothetical protein